MQDFQLQAAFSPTGDQPQAISQLCEGIQLGKTAQTLLGVTGSGKTFTIANVIAKVNKPTLILSHNKTLAAQLYNEFKSFFPNNAVEYYVSYYDYYQPEAYIASTDTYIEKDLAINEDIDRMRLGAVSALLSGRKDVIVVSSVSCIYGMGNPNSFYKNLIDLHTGTSLSRDHLLKTLIDCLYIRNDLSPSAGSFRVKGDTVDVFLAYAHLMIRLSFWGEELESIEEVDTQTGETLNTFESYKIYPANLFLVDKSMQANALFQMEKDLKERYDYLLSIEKPFEAKRLWERTQYDMEMIKELGHCSGIENYSRYFDGRSPGTRPYCLLDFFPKDFLMVIDESHVSVPQIKGMYGGDKSRKTALVEHGFRLPAALDNRPLKFEEFEQLTHQVIYISATPEEYELMKSEGEVVEQLIRPTGLLDPVIEVRPTKYQIDNLMEEIIIRKERDERILVVTLTKRMAEELTNYLLQNNISTNYIHSEVDTLERIKIMEELRQGIYTVLVGVNLLREGLDLPEVSLVAILDADKEGFLRSYRSLTQTAGRAARNVNGLVIMYADKITSAMKKTIDETNRRRNIQNQYNLSHNLTPTPIVKSLHANKLFKASQNEKTTYFNKADEQAAQEVAEELLTYQRKKGQNTKEDIQKRIKTLENKMKKASQSMDFLVAAQYRDEIRRLQSLISE